eukprot:TRINITY_DN6093_c0_g1_i1.p1 TRINITY_DN6093_c0_g1~~TRINITY_DN6093_c0_g1_i1.p1  ORF type:complete len:195 (+),score=26.12 TRINITY_DN6093_c0_g1_i1:282-866(+)
MSEESKINPLWQPPVPCEDVNPMIPSREGPSEPTDIAHVALDVIHPEHPNIISPEPEPTALHIPAMAPVAVPGMECRICREIVNISDIFTDRSGAIHNICKTCLKTYLESAIQDSTIKKVACPHCPRMMGDQTIQSFVNHEIFEKYLRFEKEREIRMNPMLRYCPDTKCSKLLVLKDPEIPEIQCDFCEYRFCV